MYNLKDYEALFENINEAVLVFNLEEIVWVNRQALGLFGCPEFVDEIYFLNNMIRESSDVFESDLNRLLVGEKTEGVFKIKHPDGSEIILVSRAFNLSNAPGELMAAFIHELPPNLIDVGDIDIVKHEVLTPLSVIKGYVELFTSLKDSDYEYDAEEFWLVIKRNIDRLEKALLTYLKVN